MPVVTIGDQEKKIRLSEVLWEIPEMNEALKMMTIEKITDKLDIPEIKEEEVIKIRELTRKKKDFDLKHGKIEPDVLIGMDHFWKFFEGNIKSIEIDSSLKIIPTKIGPIIINIVQSKNEEDEEHMHEEIKCFLTGTKLKDENKMNVNKLQVREVEDKLAIKHFEQNVKMIKNRISVKLPIRANVQSIDSNFGRSYGCLKGMLKTMMNKPEILEKYKDTIQEQVNMGILEECPKTAHPFLTYYIPHHYVLKLTSVTTKLRIVLNASSKSKTTQSLNDILYQGPKIIPNVFGMMLRIRMSKTFLMGDVEKAFHQIELEESDRDLTRMLWVKDLNKEAKGSNLVSLRFTRIPFGVNSSPFLLGASINKFLATRKEKIFENIAKNIYVDNIIINVDDDQETFQHYKTIKKVFKEIGMNIREFYTNQQEVMNQIPEKDKIMEKNFKILGMNYSSMKDELNIRIPIYKEHFITKRTILSFLNSIFDPVGFTTPILVKMKLFLKNIWEQEVQWDEKLDEKNLKEWQEIKNEIEGKELSFKRHIGKENCDKTELLLFTDASKDVIATVAYLSYVKEGKIKAIEFLCSKNSTMVEGSIPMKELSALLFGMKMTEEILKELNITIENIKVFSDSQVILCWLYKNPTKKVYVRNRLEKIKSIEERIDKKLEYFYVNTKANPADLPTRGVNRLDESYEDWIKGPTWYANEEERVKHVKTIEDIVKHNNEEIQESILNLLIKPKVEQKEKSDLDMLVQRYADYNKFIRIIRVILTFKMKLKGKSMTQKENLHEKLANAKTIAEQNRICEKIIIKIHQEQNVDLLENRKYKNLDIVRDNDGILRVRGRLGEINKNKTQQFPILLFGNKFLTNMFISYMHSISMHAPKETLISILRKEFFIVKMKRCINTVISKCMTCKKMNNRPYKYPEFPQLPKERVMKYKPFENIGIDYAGPLLVKKEGVEKKVWLMLITCSCTRAVYLDIANDCSSEELIRNLRKFFARKRIPSQLISDNGSQFIKADKLLQDFVTRNKIIWKMITPYSPWKGGFYERMVGVTKKYLIKIIGTRKMCVEDLHTILPEIENVINNRPIANIDNEFEKIITPKSLETFHPENMLNGFDEIEKGILRNKEDIRVWMAECNETMKSFWDSWSDKYLEELRADHEMKSISKQWSQATPKVGEIVLCKENNVKRFKWPMAVIEKLIKSSDGKVRSVEIRNVEGKHFLRSINQLIPLELNDENYEKQEISDEVEFHREPNLQPENKKEGRGGHIWDTRLRQIDRVDYKHYF